MKPGRPIRYLDEIEVAEIVYRIQKGAGLEEAAIAVGVSGRLVQRRMGGDRELHDRIHFAMRVRDGGRVHGERVGQCRCHGCQRVAA